MRITRQNSNEISGQSRWIDDEFDNLVAIIQAGWNVQHKADSSHSHITCDDITERSRLVPMGEWLPVPYSSLNFTANGSGVWMVARADQNTYRYMLLGTTCFVAFAFDTTSMSGTPNTLLLQLPPGIEAAQTMESVGWIDENGTYGQVRLVVSDAQSVDKIQITKTNPTATFANATDTTAIRGSLCFEMAD